MSRMIPPAIHAGTSDDAIVAFTRTLPGFYDEDEIRAALAILKQLPYGASVVELGVQYGRSTSIYFQHLLRMCGAVGWPPDPSLIGLPIEITLVDCWCINESDCVPHFWELVDKLNVRGMFKGLWMRTDEAAPKIDGPIHYLHVDADHAEGVRSDCELYLPKLAPGGWALFHDYERRGGQGQDEFPAVKEQVDRWTKKLGLEDRGVIGTLAIRRMPEGTTA